MEYILNKKKESTVKHDLTEITEKFDIFLTICGMILILVFTLMVSSCGVWVVFTILKDMF